MPDRDVIEVLRDVRGMWRAEIPADEAAGVGVGWMQSADLPTLLRQAHIVAQAEGLRVHVWDETRWVCGWPFPSVAGYCGRSVRSGPCAVHYPPEADDAAALADLFGDAAATGRHPLGRRGAGWLPVVLLAAVVVVGLALVGWLL